MLNREEKYDVTSAVMVALFLDEDKINHDGDGRRTAKK